MHEPEIRLRPTRVEDAEELATLIDEDEMRNFSFFTEALTAERERQYLARMTGSGTDHLFVIELVTENRIIGTAGLHEHDQCNHVARIGVMIFETLDRNQGYGRQALWHLLAFGFGSEPDGLGLYKVIATPFADNWRSVQKWLREGFQLEGILRGEYLRHGERHDLVRMSMLRTEWEAHVKEVSHAHAAR